MDTFLDLGMSFHEHFPFIRASRQGAVVFRVSSSLLFYVLKLDILNQVKHFYLEFSGLAKLKHFPVHKTMNIGKANHRESFRSQRVIYRSQNMSNLRA
jgi:hypothetical protein